MKYSVGDWVVYTMDKHSTQPGQRAKDIHPAERGDEYQYVVDKYWTVLDVVNENTIEVMTRRGKKHVLHTGDPHLRKAHFWECWFLKARFPVLELFRPLKRG